MNSHNKKAIINNLISGLQINLEIKIVTSYLATFYLFVSYTFFSLIVLFSALPKTEWESV